MSTVKNIEAAVRNLSQQVLSAFRAWFAKFDAEAWGRQFQKDVEASRLDGLADEALRDLREGRCVIVQTAPATPAVGHRAAGR